MTAPSGSPGLVVVGASLAGLRAVEGARAAGWTGPITLIGAEVHPPYDRPPLSKAVLDADAVRSLDATPLRSASDLDALDVDLVLGQTATGLDPSTRTVQLGDDAAIGYERLVIATGCRPLSLPGDAGAGRDGVHTLRTHDDSQAVAGLLDKGARTVVIGAGFIGSEIASAARKRDLPVAIVERLPVPLSRSLGERPGAICAGLHRDAGTDLHLGRDVLDIVGADGLVTGVQLDDGSVLPADLVVVGIGVRPATSWLAGSGVELHDRDGGVVCGPTLRTSVPYVWAAGDVTHVAYPKFDGDVMRLEHWTNAAEQGGTAGGNAATPVDEALWDEPADGETRADGIPYFWSEWYGHKIQFVGAPGADEVVSLGPDGPGAMVLYRRGDRLVGTMTVDRPRDIMKFRRQLMEPGSWTSALEMAEARLAAS